MIKVLNKSHSNLSKNVFVSSETLSYTTQNISILSMLTFCKTNSFCVILKFSYALVCSCSLSRFWCFCWSILASSFRSFTVSCCSLIWLFSDIASTKNYLGEEIFSDISFLVNTFSLLELVYWASLALILRRSLVNLFW